MADVDKNEQFMLDEVIAWSLHDYETQVAASASAYTASSSHACTGDAFQAFISCDVCERHNPSSDCFLDMRDCKHILCLACHAAAAAVPSSFSDALIRCPVRGCSAGFFLSSRPSSLPSQSFFYCNICMEQKPASEAFLDIQGCSHVYCHECVAAYVAAKVEDNESTIVCPHVGCAKGHLEPHSCRDAIAPQVFERWGVLLCEASIAQAKRFYCPYDDCSVLLVNDEAEDVKQSECPYCGRLFCAQCKVPWKEHGDVSCEKYRALGKEKEEQRKLKEVADKNGWKMCPKCGSCVERVEGCVFIMCRYAYMRSPSLRKFFFSIWPSSLFALLKFDTLRKLTIALVVT